MSYQDPREQREQLLENWDRAAKGWGRQADRTRAVAQAVSEWMLDHAQLAPGQRVLELAAGPGDTGLMAARRIAPDGLLICTDASEAMLEIARERAQEQGIANVEFKQAQLEWIDMPAADVEVILCRWALMLVVDPEAALRECRRVLKPGGRLALAVWDSPDANPWATIPRRALIELELLPAADGGGEAAVDLRRTERPADGSRPTPGMFALSEMGRLESLLYETGFFDVTTQAVAITRDYASVNDYLGETRDLSRQFATVWDTLADAQRRALRERVAAITAPYTAGDGSLSLAGSSLAAIAHA